MKTLKNILILFILISCSNDNKTGRDTLSQETKTIQILPLGTVSKKNLDIVMNSIESFYGFNCIVLPKCEVSPDILSKSKTKYDADKILKKYNIKSHTLIFTNVNICTKSRGFDEWSILGYGYQPGSICVVSTNRMNKSNSKFKSRLEKVALHEIGHNLDLPHCEFDEKCFMNDAKGTIKTFDTEKTWLCKNCCDLIGRSFVLY